MKLEDYSLNEVKCVFRVFESAPRKIRSFDAIKSLFWFSAFLAMWICFLLVWRGNKTNSPNGKAKVNENPASTAVNSDAA